MQPPPKSSGISPVSGSNRRRRVGGLGWILIAIAALFVIGALSSILRKQRQLSSNAPVQSRNALYFGIDEFRTADNGGATFNNIYPPDSPTDKARLVGGDVITIFDGREIKDKDALIELLGLTPVGKTVDVTYLRAGETRKTKLTTISAERFEQLVTEFENRPEGFGAFGFEFPESAHIPGRNFLGVRLNGVSANGPAALAGIQDGDIVIEFDGIPIRTRGEFMARVRRAIPYSTVKARIVRGSQEIEIPVKIGKRGQPSS
jgi:S1-C subfamily serine protease